MKIKLPNLLALCCLLLFACPASGQTFLFNQLFQPSIRLSGEYAPADLLPSGAPAQLGYARANMNLILPISSKIGIEVNWLEALKLANKLRRWRLGALKDLGEAVHVKMHQVFWNIRPQWGLMQFQPSQADSSNRVAALGGNTQFYGLSTGITGLHNLRRYRLLLYQFNVGFIEDAGALRRLHPTATALFGIAHLRLFNYWYYGVYLQYNNGRFLPAPFIGIESNFARRWWLNITLPVQVRLGWQFAKGARWNLTAGLVGWTGGFSFAAPPPAAPDELERSFFTLTQLRLSTSLQLRLGKQVRMQLEAGYLPVRRFGIGGGQPFNQQIAPAHTAYAGFSLFYAFKKSLLSSLVDGLIAF